MMEEERFRLELQDLYRRYGYSRFKMDKFEEYELYLRNRDFIEADNIIVFNDMNGRLLALKPDLTLSIVKNFKEEPGTVSKVFYTENIYRFQKENRIHREIPQTGLECMGDIDTWQIAEVTMLAAKSLQTVTEDFVLNISHMGLLSDLMKEITDEGVRQELVRCIGEKNLHEMRKIASDRNVPEETLQALETLISTYGTWEETKQTLEKLPLGDSGQEALTELSQVFQLLSSQGLKKQARIDFSIVNDMNYYSGILFKGYVDGVPHSVLSGGQYDKLLTRMGKKGGAVGFAVYLDYLERIMVEPGKRDVDVVLIYDEDDDLLEIHEIAEDILSKGESVLIERQVPAGIRYGRIITLRDGK